MAAKRSASAQLTSDNWEQEDENDEVVLLSDTRFMIVFLLDCSLLELASQRHLLKN